MAKSRNERLRNQLKKEVNQQRKNIRERLKTKEDTEEDRENLRQKAKDFLVRQVRRRLRFADLKEMFDEEDLKSQLDDIVAMFKQRAKLASTEEIVDPVEEEEEEEEETPETPEAPAE